MPLLEIQGLKKTYRTPEGEAQPVLDVPEFTLEPRTQCALRGASGTGKTTFLNCIAGILSADNGMIRIDGRVVTALDESARDTLRAQKLGYIFQTFNLLQGYTCEENVILGMSFGPGADAEHARELLERVGLGDRLRYRPGQLSVGQQQRVAVARALANRPTLVLADEPTGSLDQSSSGRLSELLLELVGESGTSLVVVTHAPTLAARLDRSLELRDRTLAPLGPALSDESDS